VVSIATKRYFQLIILYTVVCALVTLWALWGAGFNLKYFNLYALVVALVIYAIPFCLVKKITQLPTSTAA